MNPKDPQADIEAVIDRHTGEWKAGHNYLVVEQVMAVFQAREQQLLTELLKQVRPYLDKGHLVDALPVAVIERLQNKTNDGGTE